MYNTCILLTISFVSTYRAVYCCIDFCFGSQVDVKHSEFGSVLRPLGPFQHWVKVEAIISNAFK